MHMSLVRKSLDHLAIGFYAHLFFLHQNSSYSPYQNFFVWKFLHQLNSVDFVVLERIRDAFAILGQNSKSGLITLE
jgi:hypothetical protein